MPARERIYGRLFEAAPWPWVERHYKPLSHEDAWHQSVDALIMHNEIMAAPCKVKLPVPACELDYLRRHHEREAVLRRLCGVVDASQA